MAITCKQIVSGAFNFVDSGLIISFIDNSRTEYVSFSGFIKESKNKVKAVI